MRGRKEGRGGLMLEYNLVSRRVLSLNCIIHPGMLISALIIIPGCSYLIQFANFFITFLEVCKRKE